MTLASDTSFSGNPGAGPSVLGLPERVRFTVEEFDRLSREGLVPKRTELVEGEVFVMTADGNAHSVCIQSFYDALRPAWLKPKFIRSQSTHRFDARFAPMPDLVLVNTYPSPGATVDDLPQLVIEVSDETLAYDLGFKRLKYAQAGVPEYWVADIKRRRVLVFREPDVTATAPELAWRYEQIMATDGSVSSLAIPSLSILVSEVIPLAGV
jgi:Uma2 family endonuclease